MGCSVSEHDPKVLDKRAPELCWIESKTDRAREVDSEGVRWIDAVRSVRHSVDSRTVGKLGFNGPAWLTWRLYFA